MNERPHTLQNHRVLLTPGSFGGAAMYGSGSRYSAGLVQIKQRGGTGSLI